MIFGARGEDRQRIFVKQPGIVGAFAFIVIWAARLLPCPCHKSRPFNDAERTVKSWGCFSPIIKAQEVA